MISTYALPKIGAIPVGDVTPDDVLSVLRPVWLDKPETARRVLQRLRMVFDAAIVNGSRKDANPTSGVKAVLPAHGDKKKNFRSLPYPDLPAVMRRLEGAPGIGALALRFTILTGVRSGETRGAVWAEIDLEAACWTIPPERMKTRNGHRVPLSAPAMELLRHVRDLPGELVFPSARGGKKLSDMTLSAVLKRVEIPVTVHGFRSTFRTWAEEQTDYPHEVKEASLAHVVSNAVERAYLRSDLFDKRRALMDEWAIFCMGGVDV